MWDQHTMTSAIPNSKSSSSPPGNPQSEGDSSNCEKRKGPRLAHRKSRTGCQRCRARRVKVSGIYCYKIWPGSCSVMKRDQCVATVIVMGSPVFMTGLRKKERSPPQPGSNLAHSSPVHRIPGMTNTWSCACCITLLYLPALLCPGPT